MLRVSANPMSAERDRAPSQDQSVIEPPAPGTQAGSGPEPAASSAHCGDAQHSCIVNSSEALIAYVDAAQRYRFANPAMQAWTGLTHDDIVGRTVESVLGPTYADIQPHILTVLGGDPVSFDITLDHPRLNRRTLAFVHTPDVGGDGGVRGFCALALDITDYRERRQKDVARERRMRPGFGSVPAFLAQCGADYRLRSVNPEYAQRLEQDPARLIGSTVAELVGDDVFAQMRPRLDAALGGCVQEQELALPPRFGGGSAGHYVHLTYMPECDQTGRVHGLIATISDTTRLRRAEDRLLRHELEFKTLVENSPDIIARIDRGMRHLYVNPVIEQAFGKPAADYAGKTKAELGFPAAMVQAWDRAAQRAFASGKEQSCAYQLEVAGVPRCFSTRLIPEPDLGGGVDSLLCVTYDITDRTRIEKERDELLARERNARIQAETAARARDEFLAIVSHELRAPLNGIQSWAHVLENYVKDIASIPLAQRALQGIKTGVGQQVRLIEDLLDVTRMMSGKMRLVKQPLALLPVIQAAVESVHTLAQAKDITLACDYRITSEQIEGDSDRVQQIIWNLLSNAIKFTPEHGHVWLTAARTDKEVVITISDDGIGISPVFLPQLFDRFSQEDTSSTRDHSGLGLGLFLVRHLVELHAGRVEALSEGEGLGTTFSLHLPLRMSEKYLPAVRIDDQGQQQLDLPSLAGLRVLLIDDQEEARESLGVVLTAADAEVFSASSSREVLDWLSTRSEGDLPDVLICDIAMPGEDGYAVLRKLRAWRSADGKTPLARLPALALTAFSQREDRIRALTAGFQMHVTKPVAPEELIVVIATMVPQR